MCAYKADPPAESGDPYFPLCILKDLQESGTKTVLLCHHENLRFARKALPESVAEPLRAEFVFSPHHYHDGVEILRILEGSATVVIGGRHLKVSAGDIVIFNFFEAHSVYLENKQTAFCRSCLIFQPHLLFPPESNENGIFHLLKGICFENSIPAGHPANGELCRLVDDIVSLAEQTPPGWQVSALADLLRFYSVILRYGLRKQRERDASYLLDFMEQVNRYIEENADQDITTAGIASYCQYSTEHFCRLFKKCFGQTFKDYLNMYRVQLAKNYMDTGTQGTVAEIASLSGFNSQNHFSHMFKKYTGLLPSEYITQQKMTEKKEDAQ